MTGRNGSPSADTVFYYHQSHDVITGEYRGGEVKEGSFVGRMISSDAIELAFQCLAADSRVLSGVSNGRVSTHDDGRLRLDLNWRWLWGAHGNGEASYVEVA